MRLRTLEIRGFGQLRGVVDLETGRGSVALLLERNEAGKSTLAAAITAALYGLDGNRTRHRGRMTPLDRHRPWRGGSYGVELLLERDGRELRISRDFEQGTVDVYDGSRDVTAEFREGKETRVGEVLTGLTAAQFELSAFVPQGQIVWEDASDLAEALQRAADSDSGQHTAARAIEALDAALDQYEGLTLKKGKVDTEIQRCEAEVRAAEEELARLEARRAELDEQVEQLRRLESEEGETRTRREALRLRRAATELEFETAALAADDERRARRDVLLARLGEDPALEQLTDDVRREMATERRRHGILVTRLESLQAQIREAEQLRDQRLERVVQFPLIDVPKMEQVSEIGAWVRTRDDRREQRENLLKTIEKERARVREAGFDPELAARLAERFGTLTDHDRALLGGLRKRRLELEEETEHVRERLESARAEIFAIATARERQRRRGVTALGLGFVLAFGGAIGAHFAGLLYWIGALPGVLVLVAGLYLVLGVARLRTGSEASARTRMEDLTAALERLEESGGEMQGDLERLAARLKCSPEELEESWRAWHDLQPHSSGLSVYEERLRAVEEDERKLADGLAALEPLLGRVPQLDELDEVYAQFREVRNAADLSAVAEAKALELAGQAEELGATIVESTKALRARLAAFGIEAGDDLEPAFEDFEERASRAAELAAVRQTELPQLERLIANPRMRAVREERVEELGRRVSERRPVIERELRALGRDGEAMLATLDDPLTEEELQAGLRALEADIERRHDASTRQLTDVRSFIESYEREAPALRDRIEELGEAGRRAAEFATAVGLARDTLEGLARQTHRIWSRELSQHTNRTLAAMGSDIGEVHFDERLNLSLVQRGQRMSGADARQALSTGARDLLHLACRIALAHFLSRGELDLPLILDDPFAHCDDPRTVAGMKLLVDVIARDHQVILLACQRNRYEWVRGQIEQPDLVRTLELEDRTA